MSGSEIVFRKAAALALVLLAFCPVVAAGLWVLDRYDQGELQRQELLERFDRLRAIAAFGAHGLAEGTAEEGTPGFLGEGTPAMLAAGLHARVREIAAERGVDVVQTSDLKPREVEGLIQLGVHVEMVGPPPGIQGVLEQLERSVPWLLATAVQLRSGYSEGQVLDQEPPLSMALDIWGFALPQTEKADATGSP